MIQIERRTNLTGGTYIVDMWKNYVPALPAFGPGRQEFRLVYESGRLIESVEIPSSALPQPAAVAAPASGWLTMAQAAKKCCCSLWWFSRNWKDWGLRPSRMGRLLFDAGEIEKLLQEKRITRRGRPRKIVGDRA